MPYLLQCLQIDSNSDKNCIHTQNTTKKRKKRVFNTTALLFTTLQFITTTLLMEESHLSTVNPYQHFPSSSSSSLPSTSRVQETDNHNNNNQDQNQQRSFLFYPISLYFSDFVTSQDFRDDLCSCLLVIVTFWFFGQFYFIFFLLISVYKISYNLLHFCFQSFDLSNIIRLSV